MEEKRFIDRRDEYTELVEALNRPGAELIILYGRRRIGKSRLLKELSNKINIDLFVMLEDADYDFNLKKFSENVAKKYSFPNFSPKNFKDIFLAIPKKSIIIIDEFSYLLNGTSEFQAIWEEIAKPKDLKIILSGSLIRIMEDLNYSLSSPLYGRATKVIKLMPLEFKYVLEWFKSHDNLADIMNAYFILGGIPRYLELINKPTIENINKEFFSKDGIFLREGKLLLKENFPSSNVYPRLLNIISNGNSVSKIIADKAGLKINEISKYLLVLIDFGYIMKKYPLIKSGKKDVRFYPNDRFFSFWSKFILNNYSDIESGQNKNALEFFDKNFKAYAGREFERLVLELLISENRLVRFNKFGKQWGRYREKSQTKTYEIDIVGLNEKEDEIIFGECKWQDNVNPIEVLNELIKKTQFVKWKNESRKESFLISAKSFIKKIDEFEGRKVYCFDLNDLKKRL